MRKSTVLGCAFLCCFIGVRYLSPFIYGVLNNIVAARTLQGLTPL